MRNRPKNTRHTLRSIWLFAAALVIGSCASYKAKYTDTPASKLEVEGKPSYSFYLVGDAGYQPGEGSTVLSVLKQELSGADPKRSGVIYLGDNIYPSGLPPEDHKDRAEAEHYLDVQIDAVKDFDGDIYFIPGNHDWYADGAQEGVERQEQYVQDHLDKKVFEPSDGCSGPEVEALTDEIALIIIDSEWYLHNWDGIPEFNERCDIKTREDFLFELSDVINKNRYKRIIFAMHHPLYSHGPHGGKFSFREHLFPFTMISDKLLIPLPGLGSILLFIRQQAGIPQDINHFRYTALKEHLLSMTDHLEDVIFIAGHEHTLQYIREENHHFIVSGAGCKKSPVALGKSAEFVYGKQGFARLDIYEDGASVVEFFKTENNEAELLFRKQLTGALKYSEEKEVFPPVSNTNEQVTTSIYDQPIVKSGFYKWLFGEHYVSSYNTKITAPVLDLESAKGGLEVLKRGGGNQTNSLRLEDKNENQWVLRAMRKDPSRLLSSNFSVSFITDAVDYSYTSAHPMAAFTIPDMARALNILHTEPRYVYVPKQRALGEFNLDHGDKLYLFEGRPDDDRSAFDNFGNADKIISTGDLLEKMAEEYDHNVDQRAVLRARLFDMIIGDWDRHEDQWRWARFKVDHGDNIYKPIPRDRDQPYSKFDGVLFSLARLSGPEIAKLPVFSEEYKRIAYFNYNARFFDRTFLTNLEWSDWEAEVLYIQAHLTDVVIERGLSAMTPEIYELTAETLRDALMNRRDGLMAAARKFYEILAREVNVTGSNEDDHFIIEHLDNGGLRVSIEIERDDKPNIIRYNRVFDPKETREVRLYGRDGDDLFEVLGKAPSKIKVRVIGGDDPDALNIEGNRKLGRKLLIYDFPEENDYGDSKRFRDKRSRDYRKNAYDRKDFRYNFGSLLPNAGYNPDNGLQLGFIYNHTSHGFKKEPYKRRWRINGLYTFATKGFKGDVEGHFIDVLGDINIRWRARYQDPLFTRNFFGFGNETDFESDEREIDFYRVRQREIGTSIFFESKLTDYGQIFIGPLIESFEIERTEGRLIDELFTPDDVIYEASTFGGIEAGLRFQNIDDPVIPTKGLSLEISGKYAAGMNDNARAFEDLRRFSADLRFYIALGRSEKWTLVNALNYRSNHDRSPIFYANFLGGQQDLRGFRNERFAGDQAFRHNVSLRYRGIRIRNDFFRTTLGILAGFDYGRVWLDEVQSDEWHTSAGGGIWIAPFNAFVLRTTYFHSSDGGRFSFGMGFDF